MAPAVLLVCPVNELTLLSLNIILGTSDLLPSRQGDNEHELINEASV